MGERSWPHRFRVNIHTNSGSSLTYSVVTWLSSEKAVAIAVVAHVGRHQSGTGPMGIHDVHVSDLGPVAQKADGKMLIDSADLTDRMEF
jgi:hypothetical protein